jgi:proteasome lid subunit RPN8/RPN11
MEDEVRARLPEEACGLIIGESNRSRFIVPISNILHSSSRFRMEPTEQLKAFLLAEDSGMEILAVYHSHPTGMIMPSATDFQELTFPGIIYLIWSFEACQWSCRGYLMMSQVDAVEVPLVIT